MNLATLISLVGALSIVVLLRFPLHIMLSSFSVAARAFVYKPQKPVGIFKIMGMMCFTLMLVLTAVAWSASVVAAPSVSNAGSLLRDIEKGKTTALPGNSTTLEIPLPPEMKSLGNMRVVVHSFRFVGNHLFDDQTLASVVKPWLSTNKNITGRHLSFGDLQNAARAVAKFYRDAGWVVRTYLPQQDINKGIVTIEVVEARFGDVRMEGKSLVTHRIIARIIRKAQPVGKRIRESAIERGVLLTSDLPGMAAKYALIKGRRDRETDLAVSFVNTPRINGYIRGDNGGARSTGATRVIGGVSINSPSGIGDKVDLTLLGSRGLTYGQLQYELPVGADGWRAGISGSILNYRLGKELTALNIKGSADTLEIHARYPLIRTRTANLYIRAGIQHKLFNNEAQGVTTSHFTVDVPALSLSGNYYDTLWGPASSSGRLSFVYGRVNLAGSPNAAVVAATTGTDGNYSRINIALNRQQSIAQSLSAYLAFSGQYASKNLDSSEFMTLGGPYGVRAYPVSEGAGGSGWRLNLELRQLLPHHLMLAPFYDRGFIQINKDNAFSGATTVNLYTLQGAGFSLHWDPLPALDVKVVLARRIGKNPARQANGLDQNGSFHRYRLWTNATYRF